MEIKQLWLNEKDFAQLYKENDIIPNTYIVDDQYTISSNGKKIGSRYQIGSNKFLLLKDDVTDKIVCFVQTQQGAKAYFVSNAEVNKNGVFSVYSGGGKAKTSIPVDKEDKTFAKQLQDMSKTLNYKSIYRELNPKKFNLRDEKEVNSLIEEGMRVISEKENIEKERDQLKNQRDDFFDKIQELKWDLKNKNIRLNLAEKQIDKLVDEGLQYLSQRDAFEKKYNSELERRKILQQENKLLTEELSSLAGDVVLLTAVNALQQNTINNSLSKIRGLVDSINKKEAERQKVSSRLTKTREEKKSVENQNSKLIKDIAELKREINKSTIRNGNLDKKVAGLIDNVITQSTEIASLKTKNENLKETNQELLIEVERLLNDYMTLEAGKKTADEELKKAQARITALSIRNGGLKSIKSGAIMSGNMYRLVNAEGNESQPIYLAVGPHYNAGMREKGASGKDYETLYVVLNGNPALQSDSAGNPMTIEEVLLDPQKRNELDIHGVKEIVYDKKGNARIRHYDHKVKLRKKFGITTSDILVSDNNIVSAKDVDGNDLKAWVEENYGAGKIRQLKPTIKTRTALKCAGIIAAATLVAGAGAFGGFKAYGGPNEYDIAKQTGRTQITNFVTDLGEKQNLFQYTTAVDENGNQIKYVKNVNGVETSVYGNKVSAIGNANRVFYKDSENKIEIEAHKQQNFWGKLKDYKEATVLGAVYELGAQVVAELNENNVPVYTLDNNGNKKPIYVYLNNAANHDYSSRSSMISYLTENGYSEEMAEKITTEYESGFVSGLENGLSNKVELIIGGQGVVETKPEPVIDYSTTETKNAITAVISANTPHGKIYNADELKVCYSDISAKTNASDEQVLFVIAHKDGETGKDLNKYLYKIVLNTGVNGAITVDKLNDAILNAESVTENIKLDYMFRNLDCDKVITNFYKSLEGNNIAYVSNYGIKQNGEGFEVTPNVTIYNTDKRTVVENTAKNTVYVEVGKDSSITEMCALAILDDYGYYDKKGIYESYPTATEEIHTKSYTTGEKEL